MDEVRQEPDYLTMTHDEAVKAAMKFWGIEKDVAEFFIGDLESGGDRLRIPNSSSVVSNAE